MKKYKYGLIGSFAFGRDVFGGQGIKTKNFADELEAAVGEGAVLRIDTRGWKKRPLELMRNIQKALAQCEEVVMLPADRGVLVIPRLIMLFRGWRKNRLSYVVIGGWLPEFLLEHRSLAKVLKKFDGIYVETQMMKDGLCRQGFSNVVVLPNFKRLHVLPEEALVYPKQMPYRLCTFSRVLKEKGIEIAVDAVKAANEALGTTAYTLDIYGKTDDGYVADFQKLAQSFPSHIRYMGSVDGSKSTQIIREYFALLFPTYFYGEGYPGTLLDAFSAGVPVIASDWRYNAEIVDEEKGFLIEPQSVEALTALLLELAGQPERICGKKLACLQYANEMRPERLIGQFVEHKE